MRDTSGGWQAQAENSWYNRKEPMPLRKFKKFSNRKLYDVDESSYVSMVQVAKIVAKGADVTVEDDRTGRDITLETLARALYELLKDHFQGGDRRRKVQGDPFSPAALARLIRQIPGQIPARPDAKAA